MAITPLPPAPLPTDTQSEFNTKAFNLVAGLNPFVQQANALASDVNSKQSQAANSASSALNSANNAAASATQANNFRNEANVFATSAGVSAAAAQAAAGLPSIVGKNGFVLSVNDDASGVEFRPSQSFGAAETFVLGM